MCVIAREIEQNWFVLSQLGWKRLQTGQFFLGKQEAFHSVRMVDRTPSQALSTPACFSACAQGETRTLCINLLPTELTFTWLAHSPCVFLPVGGITLHNDKHNATQAKAMILLFSMLTNKA